jgi:hypothetical protein
LTPTSCVDAIDQPGFASRVSLDRELTPPSKQLHGSLVIIPASRRSNGFVPMDPGTFGRRSTPAWPLPAPRLRPTKGIRFMLRNVSYLLAAAALTAAAARAQSPMITEIVDGTLVGGLPKWVEIYNPSSTTSVDLSGYEIVNYNNGNLTKSGFSALSGILAPHGFFIVSYEAVATTNYQTVYGTAPDFVTGYAAFNGNDCIALQVADGTGTGAIVDVYGVIGVDGIGQAWEYTDSHAERCASAAAATFNPSEWTFFGPNALEDNVCGDPCEVTLLQNNTFPKQLHNCGSGSAITIYCTAKVNSLGCTPAISTTGTPSASAGSGFTISASSVLNNKNGLLFYSTTGAYGVPFQGGHLCAKPPVKRTTVMNSSGNPPPNDCSGAYNYDFNARIAGGIDPNLIQGAKVWAQFWARDPGFSAPGNTSLSDAVEFTIGS